MARNRNDVNQANQHEKGVAEIMDKNEQKAYTIYEKYGQDAVLMAVYGGEIKTDYYKYCNPCEYISPIYKECCLVCGTINKKELVNNEV